MVVVAGVVVAAAAVECQTVALPPSASAIGHRGHSHGWGWARASTREPTALRWRRRRRRRRRREAARTEVRLLAVVVVAVAVAAAGRGRVPRAGWDRREEGCPPKNSRSEIQTGAGGSGMCIEGVTIIGLYPVVTVAAAAAAAAVVAVAVALPVLTEEMGMALESPAGVCFLAGAALYGKEIGLILPGIVAGERRGGEAGGGEVIQFWAVVSRADSRVCGDVCLCVCVCGYRCRVDITLPRCHVLDWGHEEGVCVFCGRIYAPERETGHGLIDETTKQQGACV